MYGLQYALWFTLSYFGNLNTLQYFDLALQTFFHKAIMNNQRPKARSSGKQHYLERPGWLVMWQKSFQWRMEPEMNKRDPCGSVTAFSGEKQRVRVWKGYRVDTYIPLSAFKNLDLSIMRSLAIRIKCWNESCTYAASQIAYFCYAIKWRPLLLRVWSKTGCV